MVRRTLHLVVPATLGRSSNATVGGKKAGGKKDMVQSCLEPENNFVVNVELGKKIMMKRKSGSFVIDANFVKKPERGFAQAK